MKRILIINANYYDDITNKLVKSAVLILKKHKIKTSILTVPGVFEIPIGIKKNIGKFDAFVAIGCVIKGKTPHFQLICKSVFDSIINLSINFNKPIGNGIITALNKKQAYERCGIIKSNKTNRGLEAAKSVLSVLNNGPKNI
tara:strand:+ start:382 stop:807 length:426 start_codon:yes stop_codon:yes gene_type:complete